MNVSDVLLGINFSDDMDQFDDAGNLVFSGPALEAGVWTDAHGNTAYYPAEVIKAAAPLFIGVDILCEHQGIPIGKILEVEETDVGFKVTKGIVTSKRMSARVLEKKLRGLSIHANVKLDPIRKIVLEIFGAQEISLVKNPACKVCMLENFAMQDGGETVVEETENKELKSYESYPEPDCEQFKDSPDVYSACKEFAKAVEVFRVAQEKWHAMFTKNETGTEMSAESEEELPIEAEAEVVIEASAEIETEAEAETEVEAEAEAEAEIVASASDELERKLEAAQVELAGCKAEISVLTSRVKAFEIAERQKLEESVMSADPNADVGFIATLSAAGLEKYLDTVTRMSKPTVGATKKSIRKEEASNIVLSAPKTTETKTTAITSADIIKMLKKKQY
ncbi:MAG: hypothetical protein PHT13_00075 [Methanosarcina sp.]|nr:hypothetical protein [Methanosarcina sp.]